MPSCQNQINTEHCLKSTLRNTLVSEVTKQKSKMIKLCGRIALVRYVGPICFIQLKDNTGQMQLILNKENNKLTQFFDSKLRPGDIISASGQITFSKSGILSLDITDCTISSNCNSIIPKKVLNKNFKMTHRYLDLLINPDSMDRFTKCSLVVTTIRDFLNKNDFLEFDTQLLKSKYDGGQAKPFKTHHNALDREFFLRITSETRLKQLVIGGYEKVFEIGKSFRNEGIDAKHYPEFTMLELYQAYSNCKDLMGLVKNMINETVRLANGTNKIEYQGNTIHFTPDWHEMSTKEAILKYGHIDIEQIRESKKDLKNTAISLSMSPESTYGAIVDKLLEKKVEPNIINPTFITKLPAGMTPFAKALDDDPLHTDRAWLYAGGLDLCDIYSSLTDVNKMMNNFIQQDKTLAAKNSYTHIRDDFIEALQYGAPPMASLGMSVSRVQMLLTNSKDIQDVILFPHGW
ncbi:Aspartate--tRNA(Asp/Asn) ligase [uncultured archaeon]|nr:Aspartate--tRNA(Asp/Asn) ligase [uncultured archaeon]